MKLELKGNDKAVVLKAVNHALGKNAEFSSQELGRLLLVRSLILKQVKG